MVVGDWLWLVLASWSSPSSGNRVVKIVECMENRQSGWEGRVAIWSSKRTMEMTRRRLLAKVREGWIGAVKSSADRSDGHQVSELHGCLTGRADWWGGKWYSSHRLWALICKSSRSHDSIQQLTRSGEWERKNHSHHALTFDHIFGAMGADAVRSLWRWSDSGKWSSGLLYWARWELLDWWGLINGRDSAMGLWVCEVILVRFYGGFVVLCSELKSKGAILPGLGGK